MEELRLGVVESHFADIVWANAPMTTRQLVDICAKELNWKRPTTYTVLRKLCERGIFKMENSIVSVIMNRDEFFAIRGEQFVDNAYEGSLPAFIAAFTTRKQLTAEEVEEIKKLVDRIGTK
ncbi:MAG: BlaI/MecI/CopY family transcriptional regulator [Clostridia bacterium]|nr:BlaI/MecI/CopY family transcriptional regulator [Clostridia bacterium]